MIISQYPIFEQLSEGLLTIVWLMSDEPPMLASTGALKWISRYVEIKGAVAWATCVKNERGGGTTGDNKLSTEPHGDFRLFVFLVAGGASSGHSGVP